MGLFPSSPLGKSNLGRAGEWSWWMFRREQVRQSPGPEKHPPRPFTNTQYPLLDLFLNSPKMWY